MQSVSPVVSGGASARRWVQGCRVSQLRLRHLTCGRAIEWARTRMPHARGVAPARRDPPETRRRYASKEENGRVPRIAVRRCCRRQFLFPTPRLRFRPDLSTCGNHPSFDVAPERDEQLACHGHNGDPPRAPCQRADALAEPLCRARCRAGSEARAMRAGSWSSLREGFQPG